MEDVMSRKKTLTPKLFQRGANGNWCFRRFVNGKDKVINTGTMVRSEAEAFVKQYVALEIEAENKMRRGELAVKTAQAIMLSVQGEGIERISFDEGFQVYLDTTEDFMELASRYRESFISTCRKFFAWCQDRGIKYMDEVSDEVARNYAKKLAGEHYAPKSFDDYIKILSKFFTTVDAMKKLPNRNPFNKINIRRKQKGLVSEASHRPLEPDMIRRVMECAAQAGEDLFDLFTVGLYTGMRLKDASLLKWEAVQGDFLEIIPYKTRRYGTIARIPITGELRRMLERRRETRGFGQYVIPSIADLYWHDSGYTVSDHSQKIFVRALGKENTIMPKNEYRKVNVSIYTFGSFRTTFASLLGSHDTEYRTVMEMMGWSSWNMLKIYEKKYNFNSHIRDREKTQSVEKLDVLSASMENIVPATPKLSPTKDALERLMHHYSNVALGRIYDMSDVAIKKWMDKFGLVRPHRVLSPELTEDEILKIRQELQAA